MSSATRALQLCWVVLLAGSTQANSTGSLRGSPEGVRRLAQTAQGVDGEGWTFEQPNPELLVWDHKEEVEPNYWIYQGWLKTPLDHDPRLAQFESPPFVCLRVAARPATQQPAKEGPLLTHCGGPSSGRECVLQISNFSMMPSNSVNAHFDLWAIDQRGVGLASNLRNSTAPRCPFTYRSGEPVQPFPEVACPDLTEALATLNEEEQATFLTERLGGTAADVQAFALPLLKEGGLGASTQFGIMAFNESYVRWFYRLQKLELSLCYNAPRFKLKAPSGRKYNALQFGGSVDLAKDIEQFRRAVGAPSMSLYGLSYGTTVAGVYATMFPERTNRLILDANVDPSPNVASMGTSFAKGLSSVWRSFTTACDLTLLENRSAEELCPAAPLAESKFMQMIRDQEDSKRAASVMLRVEYTVLSTTGYPTLAPLALLCLESLWRGDMDLCMQHDIVHSSANFGGFGTGLDAMVFGTDVAGRFHEEAYVQWWEETKAEQPVGARAAAGWTASFSTWPGSARPVPPVGRSDIKPLIVGNLHDPRTDYSNTQAVRQAFPQGSLMTWQGYGHCLEPILEETGLELLETYEEAVAQKQIPPYTNAMAQYGCVSLIMSYLDTGILPLDGHTCLVPEPIQTGRKALAAMGISLNQTSFDF
mmetsp:Transcript_69345/g.162964  ORF Transcript_69345/g.162964 Transcript_69345/m.162964 type:complete len:647 (-) Transcript_69345:262-2202(-)